MFTTVLYVTTSHYCLTAELLPMAIVVYPRASTEREMRASARLNRRPAMIWLKKIFVCLFCLFIGACRRRRVISYKGICMVAERSV